MVGNIWALNVAETRDGDACRIYDLALRRDGPTLGVKTIAVWHNGEGQRLRGKPFHIPNVHRIRTRVAAVIAHTGLEMPLTRWLVARGSVLAAER